jgi:hypothetical protein
MRKGTACQSFFLFDVSTWAVSFGDGDCFMEGQLAAGE